MIPKTSEILCKVAVCIGVMGIIAVMAVDTYQRRVTKAEALVVRTEICANVCVNQESTTAKVWKHQLGWGSSEWRCGCMDGHVQVVP